MAKDITLIPEWMSNMRAMMGPGGLIEQLQGNSAMDPKSAQQIQKQQIMMRLAW